jgi:hypothetical protein
VITHAARYTSAGSAAIRGNDFEATAHTSGDETATASKAATVDGVRQGSSTSSIIKLSLSSAIVLEPEPRLNVVNAAGGGGDKGDGTGSANGNNGTDIIISDDSGPNSSLSLSQILARDRRETTAMIRLDAMQWYVLILSCRLRSSPAQSPQVVPPSSAYTCRVFRVRWEVNCCRFPFDTEAENQIQMYASQKARLIVDALLCVAMQRLARHFLPNPWCARLKLALLEKSYPCNVPRFPIVGTLLGDGFRVWRVSCQHGAARSRQSVATPKGVA